MPILGAIENELEFSQRHMATRTRKRRRVSKDAKEVVAPNHNGPVTSHGHYNPKTLLLKGARRRKTKSYKYRK